MTLLDEAIKHGITLSRLRVGESERIARVLTASYQDLSRRILEITAGMEKGYDEKPRVKRLKRIQVAIKTAQTEVDLSKTLADRMVGVAKYEAAFQVASISSVVPVAALNVSLVKPSIGMLRAIVADRPFEGSVLSKWVSKLEASAEERFVSQISIGVSQGEGIPQIARRVRDGINASVSEAQTIVRTAVNHVSAQARNDTYAENSDLVKGVRWVATLDTRTSKICRALDGKTFDLDKGPRPPAHFNCRSTTVPVLKTLKELGVEAKDLPPSTRASMGGQVEENIDYQTWLSRQSPDVQDEALGVKNAKLFREGKYKNPSYEDITGIKLEDLTQP